MIIFHEKNEFEKGCTNNAPPFLPTPLELVSEGIFSRKKYVIILMVRIKSKFSTYYLNFPPSGFAPPTKKGGAILDKSGNSGQSSKYTYFSLKSNF